MVYCFFFFPELNGCIIDETLPVNNILMYNHNRDWRTNKSRRAQWSSRRFVQCVLTKWSLLEVQLALTPAKVSSAPKTCRSSLHGSTTRDTKSIVEYEGFTVVLSSLERCSPLSTNNSTSSAFKGVW